jgi:hypothetical protein
MAARQEARLLLARAENRSLARPAVRVIRGNVKAAVYTPDSSGCVPGLPVAASVYSCWQACPDSGWPGACLGARRDASGSAVEASSVSRADSPACSTAWGGHDGPDRRARRWNHS